MSATRPLASSSSGTPGTVIGYGLSVTGYGLSVTGYGLRVMGYRLRVTGYGRKKKTSKTTN